MAKDDTTEKSKKQSAAQQPTPSRARIAQLVWLVCVLCALVLALGALLVALDANTENALVVFIKDAADAVDLGVFDRNDGVMKFEGENAGDQERAGQLGSRAPSCGSSSAASWTGSSAPDVLPPAAAPAPSLTASL